MEFGYGISLGISGWRAVMEFCGDFVWNSIGQVFQYFLCFSGVVPMDCFGSASCLVNAGMEFGCFVLVSVPGFFRTCFSYTSFFRIYFFVCFFSYDSFSYVFFFVFLLRAQFFLFQLSVHVFFG